MNILGIGTTANYVKSMALNMKWKERKQDPLKPKDDDPRIAELKRQAEQQRRSNKINSIYGKMLSGSRLTQADLEYLRENSPENYEKAVKIEKEREEYKRELEQCKSKEDVEKLSQRKLSQFCSEAKAISSNPNISKDKKRELLEFIGMRMAAIMNEHADFKQTPEYHNLPEKTADDERGDAPVKEILSGDKKLPRDIELKDYMEVLKDLIPGFFSPADSATVSEINEPVIEAAAPITASNHDTTHIYNVKGQCGADFAAGGARACFISIEV